MMSVRILYGINRGANLKRSRKVSYVDPSCHLFNHINISLGLARIRNHPLNTLIKLPHSLDSVVEKGTAYRKLREVTEDLTLLSVNTTNDDDIDEAVVEQAKHFVEAVLLGDKHWIFVTHFDIFVGNNRGIDDCARVMTHKYSLEPKVCFLDKDEYGNEHHQLVIQWANVELLALAGYWGSKFSTSRTGFLGSAIPVRMKDALKEDTEYATCVPVIPVKHGRSTRLLRDYTKIHASKLWSFESWRFTISSTFRVCHPLAYEAHFTQLRTKETTAGHLCSLLLRVLASRIYTRQDRQKALDFLAMSKDVQDSIKTGCPASLSTIEKLIEKSKPKSTLLHPLRLLVKIDATLRKNDQKNITVLLPSLRLAALKVYNGTYARMITTANKKTLQRLSG